MLEPILCYRLTSLIQLWYHSTVLTLNLHFPTMAISYGTLPLSPTSTTSIVPFRGALEEQSALKSVHSLYSIIQMF